MALHEHSRRKGFKWRGDYLCHWMWKKNTCNLLFLKTFFFWLKWFPDYSTAEVASAVLFGAENKAKHHGYEHDHVLMSALWKLGPASCLQKSTLTLMANDLREPHNRRLNPGTFLFSPVAPILWHKNKFDKDALKHFVYHVSLLL